MAMTFPIDCTSAGDRTEYLYRLHEKLRLEHNAQGARLREGAITEGQWRAWLEGAWKPRHSGVMDAILHERKRMAGNDPAYAPRWEPDTEQLAGDLSDER